MDISDILKTEWIRDEEFPEKWYDSEICLPLFAKNSNPLASVFTRHGLNVLLINDLLYSENSKDFYYWDKDRERAAKNLKLISTLTNKQHEYLKRAEDLMGEIKKSRKIGLNELEKIKKVFSSLWCIFLTDLGKPFSLEVEKKLNNKKLTFNQKEEIRDYLSNLKSKLSITTKKALNLQDIKFLEAVRKCIFIDNYAADIYLKIDFLLESYLSKKFNIRTEELVEYSFTELEKLIRYKFKLSPNDIKERRSFRVMAQINGKIEMFYGKKNFERIKSVLRNNIKVNTVSFSGITASKGIAKGHVKIVKTIKDMDKVKKGDILVASTTRPDLMPALIRCAAIITDTGGITSHAAIISRELKIPCIVGTDIATQVLKDGNLVEVNANKGIIHILK